MKNIKTNIVIDKIEVVDFTQMVIELKNAMLIKERVEKLKKLNDKIQVKAI